MDQLDRELAILEKETALGKNHEERMAEILEERESVREEFDRLTRQWEREMETAGKIRDLYREIQDLHAQKGAVADEMLDVSSPAAADDDGAGDESPGEEILAADGSGDTIQGSGLEERQAELAELEAELGEQQKDMALVHIAVDVDTVSSVISGWTGIPTGSMLSDEIDTVLSLSQLLKKRIIGQDHGLEAIEQVIQTAHAGIEDPSKPTGVFMLVGPSGVGKTETALALSELLYGGEQNMITINMSEYQEAHTVSSLKGSPPGYVGYGEGGVLTEAVRRRPYSVVLLDEVEKAHPDVMEMFYQVFDKGMMEDGEGRVIDFKNTLIILTSNLGTDMIMKVCADRENIPEAGELARMLTPDLQAHFKPAFLGRMKIVPYFPILDDNMKLIIRLKLDRIVKRMAKNKKIEFIYEDAIIDAIAGRCTEVDSGARNVDHILTNTLLPEMSREMLSKMAKGESIQRIEVDLDGEGFRFDFV
jgi:type VI secretion system protein VasG